MSTNGFALLTDKDALLFDTGTEELLPLINQLCDQGFSPRGLVRSHRHIAGLGGAVPVISREYGVPVFCIPSTPGIHKQWPRALRTKIPLGTR